MIECADPATCQALAEAQKQLVVELNTIAVLVAVGLAVVQSYRNVTGDRTEKSF